jgi:cohesin complex subunit SA-1/2
VVGFFAENVNAAYEATVEEMGGEEALNEALAPPDDEEEEYHNPRLEWLKLKCLVDQLLSYDEDEAELPSQIQRMSPGTELLLIASGVESRRSLAAQALYDVIPEIRSWEVVAGYLLYDHSQTDQDESDDPEIVLRQTCQLEEKHETILLDILSAEVVELDSDEEDEEGQEPEHEVPGDEIEDEEMVDGDDDAEQTNGVEQQSSENGEEPEKQPNGDDEESILGD